MRTIGKASTCACLSLLALWGVEASAKAPPRAKPRDELNVLHVLLLIDSNANIGASVAVDGDNMTSVLTDGVADGRRLDVKRMDGADATPANVLKYYQSLQPGPNDALFFYYSGHGATYDGQHTLTLDAGNLSRQDLLDAMKATNAPLIIALTDCCSNAISTKGRKTAPPPAHRRDDNPVVHALFFQARGVVDVTASTLDSAMGGPDGGFFTRALITTMRDRPENIAGPDDGGFVTWGALFDKVKQGTSDICDQYVKDTKDKGLQPQVDRQVPFAWSLGDGVDIRGGWRFGIRVVPNKGGGVKVTQVVDGSPAKKLGIEVGDVLVAIDGKSMDGTDAFTSAIDMSNGRVKVRLRNGRDGKEVQPFDVQLARTRN